MRTCTLTTDKKNTRIIRVDPTVHLTINLRISFISCMKEMTSTFSSDTTKSPIHDNVVLTTKEVVDLVSARVQSSSVISFALLKDAVTYAWLSYHQNGEGLKKHLVDEQQNLALIAALLTSVDVEFILIADRGTGSVVQEDAFFLMCIFLSSFCLVATGILLVNSYTLLFTSTNLLLL